VTQPKSAVKKISILIKTRRSATTSHPPMPPLAAAHSPKHGLWQWQWQWKGGTVAVDRVVVRALVVRELGRW
jgi:hypothetical protein